MRLRYEEHTWPELRELAERDDLVVVIPTATLEDHGYHLPIDTDARLVTAIAERAVAASDGQALLFPTQVHGYTPHHLDFPGSVTLRWNVFVEALVDQGRSLCRHGFDRILIVNGHGSNQPLVDIAARLIGLEHRNAVCGSCFYLQSERGQAEDRRGARLRVPGRDGARLRARDVDLPRARAGPRADGQGGARRSPTGTRSTCGSTGPTGRSRCGRTGRALAAAAWWAMRLWPRGRRAKPCFRPRSMR